VNKYKDKEWLQNQYVELELSTYVIAKKVGCTAQKIYYWLLKHNIPTRSRGESIRLRIKKSGRSKITRQCKHCGNPFSFSPSKLKTSKGKFCSRHCFNLARRTRMSFICKVCGKAFTRKPSQVLTRGAGKTCSIECRGKARSGENNNRWKGGKKARICKVCGKAFKTKASEVKKGWGRFCSVQCKIKGLQGKNAPNWRGGTSFLPYPTTFNEPFKRKIRERDNYTCAICKLKGICVHHINYIKKDTTPGNCITLCKKCHNQTNFNRNYWQAQLENIMEKRNG